MTIPLFSLASCVVVVVSLPRTFCPATVGHFAGPAANLPLHKMMLLPTNSRNPYVQ